MAIKSSATALASLVAQLANLCHHFIQGLIELSMPQGFIKLFVSPFKNQIHVKTQLISFGP